MILIDDKTLFVSRALVTFFLANRSRLRVVRFFETVVRRWDHRIFSLFFRLERRPRRCRAIVPSTER